MSIYPEGSPERDAELERAAEARRMWAELRETINWSKVPEWHDVVERLGVLRAIELKPVELTAPEYKQCPECGQRGKHVCPHKD